MFIFIKNALYIFNFSILANPERLLNEEVAIPKDVETKYHSRKLKTEN